MSARRRGWATHLQRRFRNCSADCRRCVGERRCNRVAATTPGLRINMTAFWDWVRQQLQSCSCNHGGLTPPGSCSRAVFVSERVGIPLSVRLSLTRGVTANPRMHK